VFSFEPEVFPALIYRMVRPRAVFLMFVNGKVVLTGNISLKNFQFFNSLNSFIIPGKSSLKLDETLANKLYKIQPSLLVVGEINGPKQIMVYT